jgi:Pretoxin HINT domain
MGSKVTHMTPSAFDLGRALLARTLTCNDARHALARQADSLLAPVKLVHFLRGFVDDEDLRKRNPGYAEWQEGELRAMLDELYPAGRDAEREYRAGGVVAGTLVHTDKGLVPIEAILVGDLLLSQEEGSSEKSYRKVVKTVVCEDRAIRVIKYCADDSSLTLHLCYVTAGHLFWVDGAGWTRAEDLREGQYIQLMDGGRADVLLNRRVSRTPEAGFGWVPANMDGRGDAAHIVDFRAGSNLWTYRVGEVDRLHVRYVTGNIDFLAQMEAIFASDEPLLKTLVYDVEVEGSPAYCIGESGVLIRSQRGKN